MGAIIKVGQVAKDALRDMKKRRKGTRAAIMRAIDDTTKQLRKRASQEIRKTLAVPAGTLTKRIRRSKAFPKKLSAVVYIDSGPVSLSRFKKRKTPDGVAVTIFRGETAIYPGTFGTEQPMLNGGTYRRTGSDRLPIQIVPGPILSELSIATGAVDRTKRQIPELFPKNLKRRLRALERGAE